jgi:N-acetylmuramoyl-L-alanine amidase
MQKYHYIIDAGHGGLDSDGNYTTSTNWWKRSYFKDGELLSSSKGVAWLEANADEKFYEGVSNRDIRDRLSKLLMDKGIVHSYVADTYKDVPLMQRVYQANIITAKQSLPCIFISIHSNAGRGTGNEIYTSKGVTKADAFGQCFAEALYNEFEEEAFRKDLRDGDWDKEADFAVLRYTAAPSVLTENFFYDNYEDYLLLKNDCVKQRIAEAHYNAILEIEKNH